MIVDCYAIRFLVSSLPLVALDGRLVSFEFARNIKCNPLMLYHSDLGPKGVGNSNLGCRVERLRWVIIRTRTPLPVAIMAVRTLENWRCNGGKQSMAPSGRKGEEFETAMIWNIHHFVWDQMMSGSAQSTEKKIPGSTKGAGRGSSRWKIRQPSLFR